MNRDTKRLLIHVPFGAAVSLTALVHWTIPLIAAFWFYYYEHDEDHWISDQAWKDVRGAIWGLVGMTLLILIYRSFA